MEHVENNYWTREPSWFVPAVCGNDRRSKGKLLRRRLGNVCRSALNVPEWFDSSLRQELSLHNSLGVIDVDLLTVLHLQAGYLAWRTYVHIHGFAEGLGLDGRTYVTSP